MANEEDKSHSSPSPGMYLLESGLLPELTMQQDQPWSRRPGEGFWYARFLGYLRLGRGRSIYRVFVNHREKNNRLKTPPTRVPASWERAASRFEWEARAESWDNHLEELGNKRTALAREILRLAAPEAALALIQVMREGTPIQQRQAARAILDRVDEHSEDLVTPIQYIVELNSPEDEESEVIEAACPTA